MIVALTVALTTIKGVGVSDIGILGVVHSARPEKRLRASAPFQALRAAEKASCPFLAFSLISSPAREIATRRRY